jgi:hypothetical protein
VQVQGKDRERRRLKGSHTQEAGAVHIVLVVRHIAAAHTARWGVPLFG